LIGQDQHNYGRLQLSDKYNDAEFTQEDEIHLMQLAQLTATTLDAQRTIYQDSHIGLKTVE
jgi:GAF domain-containing protein